jgi:zinc D-Ala-D-Ala dipeptidase
MDNNLTRIKDVIPDILVDLKYATNQNCFGKKLYDSGEAYLLDGSVSKLARAEANAREQGVRLIVLDAYRPLSVQALMWEIFPSEGFVAPMSRGSIHNRGAAIDVTLAALDGTPLPMPSEFDEFSERAAHSYEGCGQVERENRDKLRSIMENAGFTAYVGEWWHYNDKDLRASPLVDVPISQLSDNSKK